MTRPKVLTWNVHGSYLFYLTHAEAEFYLPIQPEKEGYGGRIAGYNWGANVHEVSANDVKNISFEIILFQSRKNYLEDQYAMLSAKQRRLPRIYLEHDPPREHPTDTCHVVDDPNILIVHVTDFNRLMWDCGRTPTKVIDHGVMVPQGVRYTGEIPKGIVAVNNLKSRGRRLGLDVFEYVRQHVPLDLIGLGSEALGGLGEVPHAELPAFMARYRFFCNPIRYTSLGLAVCEALMTGLPVVGLATTEMATAVQNGKTGYADTNVDKLIGHMQRLLNDPDLAHRLGDNARRYANQRFNLVRFARDWSDTFREVLA